MNRKGQTLVELAVLFPTIIFFFAVFYYFILFVRTEIELRQSAQQVAARVAVGGSSDVALLAEAARLESFNGRWGLLDPGRSSVQTVAIPSWQAYFGVGTLDGQGAMIQVKLVYDLFPHLIENNSIPRMSLHAYCELPKEPVISGENG